MSAVARKHRVFGGKQVAITGRLASMSRDEAFEIIERHGGTVRKKSHRLSRRTDYLVVGMLGWPLDYEGRLTNKLQDVKTLNSKGHYVEVLLESVFLSLVSIDQLESQPSKCFPREHVLALVGIDLASLELWDRLGLVRSDAEGRYDYQDLISLKTIASLMRQRIPPRRIHRSLQLLSVWLPGIDRPLAQLETIISEPDRLIVQWGGYLLDLNGQHYMPFYRADAAPEANRLNPLEMNADVVFDNAVQSEDEGRIGEAEEAYRRVIELDPTRSEAYFNLGNMVRLQGRFEAAEELYRLAALIDPRNASALYNLARIQYDDKRYADAVRSLSQALRAAPRFADAHFNLALALERQGDAKRAEVHWKKYLVLDPGSERAPEAQKHLARSRDRDNSSNGTLLFA